MARKPVIAILMGSKSDMDVMSEATRVLAEFNIPFEKRVMSAHRTPDKVRDFVLNAEEKGFKIFIAGAGKAAHLAGMIAAMTLLPVIGVPMPTSDLGGLDSLLSTVQMPGGVPVATTAIGKAGARNAAILAAEILALSDENLKSTLQHYREMMRDQVDRDDKEIN